MSNIGKTLLKGHALLHEGRPAFDREGNLGMWGEGPYAKCECGELSPFGLSQSAAKQWHREHKDSLRPR